MILLDKQTDEFRLAVWNVEEDVETLLSLLPDSECVCTEADKRSRSDTRKKEWIAVRVLLYAMLQKQTRIEYTGNGAPFLPEEDMNISISHTSRNADGRNVMYVAVALSRNHRIGIDIECLSERVVRVKDKFVGDEEKAETLTSLLLHWSAKESAFKVLSTEGVDFIRHLHVEPFEEANEGSFALTESRTDKNSRMNVTYKIFDNFILTFICTD
ncbi:MAG: 4'-phosphopantetheinyl transferase superfamily protein [Prevotellaceae bacterium]|nr:4'-phosphopantetheinyl transferase superfamily protein [Prevotellaceae bacterium]